MVFVAQVSHSKLDSYNECGYKYYIRYHEHLPEKRDDTALQFGSYIHKILERGLNETTLSALEVIAEEEKKNYKFEDSYLVKIPKCLKNFLNFNTQISVSQTIGSELKEEMDIGDIKYVGIIDRVLQAEDKSVMILDYKTSKREKTKLELSEDPQLIGYAVCISRKFDIPIQKITCAHYYPITGNFVSVTFNKAHETKFLKKIKDTVWQIRKKTKKEFLPKPNKFCDWCGFKYACVLFNTQANVDKIIAEHRKSQAEKDKLIKG